MFLLAAVVLVVVLVVVVLKLDNLKSASILELFDWRVYSVRRCRLFPRPHLSNVRSHCPSQTNIAPSTERESEE